MSKISQPSENDSSGKSSSSISVPRDEAKIIEINSQHSIYSIAFLPDGKQVMSGDTGGKIRRWRVEDGTEVGTPMDAGSAVCNIAVSRDGKRVVGGTKRGVVTVWNVENHKKVTEYKGHRYLVRAVDISTDGTRVASGSDDKTARVWSLSTGQQLLGPLEHDDAVVTVKLSPDARFIATATWNCHCIRIYDGVHGRLLFDFPIRVNSRHNQSLVWSSNSKNLFALSFDGHISCLDVSSGTRLPRWPIHNSNTSKCIALTNNDTVVAVSANASEVSFWDTTTQKQIGSIIKNATLVVSLAISANYDIAIGGGNRITVWNICNVLPSRYMVDVFPELALQRMRIENVDLEETVQSLRAREVASDNKIVHLEKTVQQLHTQLSDAQHRADSLSQILHAHEQKHQCETLYADGCIIDSAVSLLQITSTDSEEVKGNKLLMNWLAKFTDRCIDTLERTGDRALSAEKYDEAVAAYSTALMLSASAPDTLLMRWARTVLVHGSVNTALSAALKFNFPRFVIYRAICDVLEMDGDIMKAVKCFRQMKSELGNDSSMCDERTQWEFHFQQRCKEKLQQLGDAAMGTGRYNEAAEYFSTVLSFNPVDRVDILIKRSTARASMNLWVDALGDADEAIKLDPSSHLGYERRHAALHGARRHAEAVEAFHMMLSKLKESRDVRVRGIRSRYIDATPTIRSMVEQTIRHMPRVLIDTTTGCLCSKKEQAAAFEALPIYSELVSSITMELDYARIWGEVKGFYRYVMLSHKWEHDEPLLQKVEQTTVYGLDSSPVNAKLQMFCSLARSFGFRWAWSDTCCVDKVNNVVLQESLVAMFTWYRGSSLTIVYLRGVSSESQLPDSLRWSIWNTRAWTYQEYVAAETVRFYTEDWKPYLGLTLSNHKESPAVVLEMQQATGVSAQELAILRPGLDRVREKLYLASMRQTTLMEDTAYSLLGIFNVSIPVIYGEGIERAVGRLLEHVLTGSGDVTILAWTGRAGSYNSCLPGDLTVYSQLMPPQVPQPIETAEMDLMVAALNSSLPDPSLAVRLYDRVTELPSPSLASSRLRLPGIVFRLTDLVHTSGPDPKTKLSVYDIPTAMFGDIVVKTAENLAGMKDLYLVHPWIRPLLDQDFSRGVAALDTRTQALRFVARLRQPFGALLFEPLSRVEYRRVAADSLITVQLREEVSLTELIGNIRTIEVQ